jgi:hypothetical protein
MLSQSEKMDWKILVARFVYCTIFRTSGRWNLLDSIPVRDVGMISVLFWEWLESGSGREGWSGCYEVLYI